MKFNLCRIISSLCGLFIFFVISPLAAQAEWCSDTADSQYCVLCDDSYIGHFCDNSNEQCPEGISESCFGDGYSISCVCYGPETPIEDPGCTGYLRLVAGNLENVEKLNVESDDDTLRQIDPSREVGAFNYFELDEDQVAYDPGYSIEEEIAIPVGTSFYLQYEGNRYLPETPADGCPLAYNILYSKVEVSEETVNPPLGSVDQQVALFKDNVIVPFSSFSSGRVIQLFAAHYGQATLKITPDSRYGSYFPPITVNVIVVPPKDITTSRGDSFPQYGNPNIIQNLADIVHRRGMPLKLLLAQIEQESVYKPQSYRYEPLLDYRVQENNDPKYYPILKQQEIPYSPQNVAANIPGAYEAEDMNYPDDIQLRNNSKYSLRIFDAVSGKHRLLRDDDFPTTADLINANLNQNWSVEPRTSVSSCAQTTVAASYGLVQVLFLTAVDMTRKYGLSKEVTPSRLVDTASNLEEGWGSLNLGTLYLMDRRRLKKSPYSYASFDMLLHSFDVALQKYNGRFSYSEEVLNRLGHNIIIPDPDPLSEGFPYISYYIFYRHNGYC